MGCETCLRSVHEWDARICHFYHMNDVKSHGDITLHLFDNVFPIRVFKREGPSYMRQVGGQWYVFQDTREDLYERRVTMAHEIGHMFLHAGNQMFGASMSHLNEEAQANRFAMYALVPTCFLLPLLPESCDGHENLCAELAEAFGVPEWFMRERCQRFQKDGIAELI